ncbi:MAG: hypothetical protein JWN09_2555 [Microbacteriaceae bacterium]|jgi:glucosamine--fructose-6-phosphate aminotransferase (isomerizing)|nr:hypothetical protein [Microbacteriaceae bacterium]
MSGRGTQSAEAGAFMRAEISEQPGRWLDLLAGQRAALEAAALLLRDGARAGIIFVARGSSDHAAMYGQYLAQVTLGVPAYLASPSVSSVYGTNVFTADRLVIGISQSGSSPDLLATLQHARDAGAQIVAFTNDPSSPMARIANVHVALSAGPELSVAATKTYTAELVAQYVCIQLASGVGFDTVRATVERLAKEAESVIRSSRTNAPTVVDQLVEANRVLVIGRGYSMSTAKEAALKLMETCGIAASGWSAADAKHGPIGQIVESTPVFLLTSSLGEASVRDLIPGITEKRGRVRLVGSAEQDDDASATALRLPAGLPESCVPIVEIIPFQILALELALRLGRDPDRPIGLSKVTQTV